MIASRRVISFTPALILCQFFLFSLSLSLSLCLAPSPRSPARCCLRWNSSSRRTSRVRGAKASDDRSFVSNENSLLLLLSFNVRLLRHGHGPSAVGIRTDGHHEICQKMERNKTSPVVPLSCSFTGALYLYPLRSPVVGFCCSDPKSIVP